MLAVFLTKDTHSGCTADAVEFNTPLCRCATFPPMVGKGCTSSMLAVFLAKDTHSGCTADAVSLALQAPSSEDRCKQILHFYSIMVGYGLRIGFPWSIGHNCQAKP
jgi:hypothetical protein